MFVCMGYAVKITTHAVEAVTGADKTAGIVAAESTSVGGLRKRFGSGDLRLRGARDRVIRQGNGWVVEGGSPYGSYAGTPLSGTFSPQTTPMPTPGPYTPAFPPSPAPNSAALAMGSPRTPSYGSSAAHNPGLGLSAGAAASPRPHSMLSPHSGSPFPTAATAGSAPGAGPYSPAPPGTPSMYTHFPPTPNPSSAGPGVGGGSVFAAQQGGGPPRRVPSNGSASAKKDD